MRQVAEQAQPPQSASETHEAAAWQHEPLKFVERAYDEAGPVRTPHPDAAAKIQYRITNELREKGLGTYADLPEALAVMGPRLIREGTLDQLPLSNAERAGAYMLAALMTMPVEGYAGGSVPHRKQETPEQTVFRVVIGHLRYIGQSPPRPKEMSERALERRKQSVHAQLASRAHPDDEALKAATEEAEQAFERARWAVDEYETVVGASQRFVEELAQATFSGQSTQLKLREAGQSYGAEEAKQSDWIPLPPVPSDARPVDTSGLSPEEAELVEQATRYRHERINDLYALKNEWGEGNVAESNFSGRSAAGDAPRDIDTDADPSSSRSAAEASFETNHYFVAILPQHLPDGRIIEHAVVDNPLYGNALFVFRAESGFRPDGTTITWRDIFTNDHTKDDWKRLGAVKITHQGDWQNRVLEVLTRNLAEE